MSSDYTGTDMFISLSEFGGMDDQDAIAELSVRALCSNRHLTEHLPIGVGGADFRLVDDFNLGLVCVAGPTAPREPVIRELRSRSETAHTGTVTWRLVNLLSTNHLGLVERGAGNNAEAVRETLSIFAEMPIAPPSAVSVVFVMSTAGRSYGASASAAASASHAASRYQSPSTRRRSRAPARSCSAPCSTASLPNIPASIISPRP